MTLTFTASSEFAIPLHLVGSNDLDQTWTLLANWQVTWAKSQGFTGSLGQVVVIPDQAGAVACALVGYGTAKDRARSRFVLGGARNKLPEGTYTMQSPLEGDDHDAELLGWLLAGYRFDRYAEQSTVKAHLTAPENKSKIEAIAAGEALTRDLINTPACDMGPADLQKATETLAAAHGATTQTITGDALLDENYPLIHTVGRASTRPPRLVDMRWGSSGSRLTLVGKGVCFDTGGLNLKPGGSMGLMKKDMGGAAAVLGLAHMIMASAMPIQLRVLIPAVENAVSGEAFRPGDIFTSRKGLSVEINNTDAEGRLVLADALALADEETPDLIVSMATLTGAARVAVGPDLAPFYTDTDAHSDALHAAADRVADPVWRMPFHAPYETLIEPGIADLDNAPKGGFAGSITAALFLRRFVTQTPYIHFDIYGWQPASANGRPKGGVGQGTRAVFDALPQILKI